MTRLRRRSALAALWAWTAAMSVPHAPARQPDIAEGTPEAVVEQYLGERGMSAVLAAHWRRELSQASGGLERARVAERLGRLYVKELSAAASVEDRRRVEDRARELLQAVPEAESYELRLDLARASYAAAQKVMESDRLRVASPEEVQDAERALRTVGPIFKSLGAKLSQRVDQLEAREHSGREAETEEFRRALGEARRLRSIARFYAGWSLYYVAARSGELPMAMEAAAEFGWLLNAGAGRQPTLERLPRGLLRYEHVARAAIGCALVAALRGRDSEAVAWLDAVENGEDLDAGVRAELFQWRLIVLASAKRWADVELIVRRKRQPDRRAPATPLPVAEARLLTVLALEAGSSAGAPDRVRELAEPLAQVGLGDLVVQGEAGHVLDLVSRYGTAPIGHEGFIVQLVRGLRAFERGREVHRASLREGESDEEPARDPAVVNAYREAAALLDGAFASDDADRFGAQRHKARLRAGLCLFYAGEFAAASERFRSAFEALGPGDDRREALWFAIVALDHAVEAGKVSLAPDRDRLATLFLETFPGTEQAAKLLLRRAGALLSDDRAAKILLDVPKESPLWRACRREASRLLYRMYRRAGGPGRDLAALRFAQVAEEVLDDELAQLEAGGAPADTGPGAVLRARQIADALLSMSVPDPSRARRALASLHSAADLASLGIDDLAAEIACRRLQIALAEQDVVEADAQLDRLSRTPGEFLAVAERLAYRDAARRWADLPGEPASARRVVRLGTRVLAQAPEPDGPDTDASVIGVLAAVADAAAFLARAESDAAMRDLAIRLDLRLARGERVSPVVLRRLADMSEMAGDAPRAIDCWRRLLAAESPASPAWFEARFHSIRLLAKSDPDAARAVMEQHRILYPTFGPEPWGDRLRQLSDALAPPPPAPGPREGGSP